MRGSIGSLSLAVVAATVGLQACSEEGEAGDVWTPPAGDAGADATGFDASDAADAADLDASDGTCPASSCAEGEVCRDGQCVVEEPPDTGAPPGSLVVATVGIGAAAGTNDECVVHVNGGELGFIGASPDANSSPQTLALPLSADDHLTADDRLVVTTLSSDLAASFSRMVDVELPDSDAVAGEPGLVLVTAPPSTQVTVTVEGETAAYVSAMYSGKRTSIVPVSAGETWRASISGNAPQTLVSWVPMERGAFISFAPPEARDLDVEHVAESDGFLSISAGSVAPGSRDSYATLTVDDVVVAYVGIRDNQWSASEGRQTVTVPIMAGQRWTAATTAGCPPRVVWRAIEPVSPN